MPHSVAPIKAAVCNKARRPLGCRQYAGHKEEEKVLSVIHLRDRWRGITVRYSLAISPLPYPAKT